MSPAQWGQFLQFYLQNVESVKNGSLKTCNFNSLQTKSDISGRGAVGKATNYNCGENGAGNYNAEGGVDGKIDNCGGDPNVED